MPMIAIAFFLFLVLSARLRANNIADKDGYEDHKYKRGCPACLPVIDQEIPERLQPALSAVSLDRVREYEYDSYEHESHERLAPPSFKEDFLIIAIEAAYQEEEAY